MRFVSFQERKVRRPSWGLLVDRKVVDLPVVGNKLGKKYPSSLIEFISEGRSSWPRANAAVEALRAGRLVQSVIDLEDVRLLAPIPRPPKNVFALGLNYADHVAESGPAIKIPEVPIYFSKAATAVIGTDEPVVADPRLTKKLDWEVELGVVIGVGGRWITSQHALDHVFGYTVINDLSARDQQAGRPEGQWFLGKSLDGFCPMGPVVVSKEEIPDPQRLEISLRVNGVEKQRASTRHMIFSVAAIIADLSHYIMLEPGDVVEAEIESIGVLRTPVTGPEK